MSNHTHSDEAVAQGFETADEIINHNYGGYDDDHKALARALLALKAENERLLGNQRTEGTVELCMREGCRRPATCVPPDGCGGKFVHGGCPVKVPVSTP